MKLYFTLTLLLTVFICKSQNDTIFLNNKKIVCVVEEITPDAVKFSYPNETLSNSIYKNTIQSITFANGRVQTFNESTSFKSVDNVNDNKNVSITRVEREVNGLFKLGEVSSKSVGTTIFSNQEQVKERAYEKLKIQGAFQGGNLVYLTDQRTDGNKSGLFTSSTAETNLTGVLYTTELPSFDRYVNLISDRKEFVAIQENELKNSSFGMKQTEINKNFIIEKLENENGLILIKGKLEDLKGISEFRVVSYTDDSFNIFYEDKRAEYNIKVQL